MALDDVVSEIKNAAEQTAAGILAEADKDVAAIMAEADKENFI